MQGRVCRLAVVMLVDTKRIRQQITVQCALHEKETQKQTSYCRKSYYKINVLIELEVPVKIFTETYQK